MYSSWPHALGEMKDRVELTYASFPGGPSAVLVKHLLPKGVSLFDDRQRPIVPAIPDWTLLDGTAVGGHPVPENLFVASAPAHLIDRPRRFIARTGRVHVEVGPMPVCPRQQVAKMGQADVVRREPQPHGQKSRGSAPSASRAPEARSSARPGDGRLTARGAAPRLIGRLAGAPGRRRRQTAAFA